jgi:hypothetical protein
MSVRQSRASLRKQIQMSIFLSRAKSRNLIVGALLAVVLIEPAMGQESTAVPNFSPTSRTGWIAGVPDGVSPIGQDFLQPPSGPGPVTFDKAHPYLDTAAARRANAQPTLRVADLSNPILQPWVREELRKVNERALTAIVMFTPKDGPLGFQDSFSIRSLPSISCKRRKRW